MTTRFESIVRGVTAFPSARTNDEQFVALVAGALMVELWPVICHPSAYRGVWRVLGRILLRARELPYPTNSLYNALVAATAAAQESADDATVFSRFSEISARFGVSVEELARHLGRGIVTAEFSDPSIVAPSP